VTLAEAWASYRRDILPADLSEQRVNESRRDFYAGAFMLLSYLTSVAEDPSHDPFAVEHELVELWDECRRFAQDVEMGVA
jgi:hypothetical protein